MKETIKEVKTIEKDEIVFISKYNAMYIKEVNEYNEPISFTENISESLSMPNTINFKNSKKYQTLIEKEYVVPVNKVVEKITKVTTEELL